VESSKGTTLKGRINDVINNVPIGAWAFIDMYPKSKPPKTKPRFHFLSLSSRSWITLL